MWQRIINCFKRFFSRKPLLHVEDSGLWWQQVGNLVKVGLDSKVITELGDITFLETPQVDDVIHKSDHLINIEGGKAVETFKSPVSGKIVKVYTDYQNNPVTLVKAKNPLLIEIITI